MSAWGSPIVIVGPAFVVAYLMRVAKDAISAHYARQCIQAEVARATAGLRRVEHEATRQICDVAHSFIDVESEEE